jgi:enoyl-CoA hydratase/carnithine racemase
MEASSKLLDYRPTENVRQLVLNDPDTRNALGLELRAALTDALRNAAADAACRVVILTAKGRTFASGSDIKMLAAAGPDEIGRPELREIWDILGSFPKPLVVGLNGHALGGGLELALSGDIILAIPGIKLGTPEPKLGIMPGGGATQRLVRAIGTYRALRLLLTAETIDAETAERWGIVTEICLPEELDTRLLTLATGIAALPPLALRAIKEAVRIGGDLPLAEGLAMERERFQSLFGTADKREGMDAFLGKRPPRFEGR